MRSSGNDETNNDLSDALKSKYSKLRNALSVDFNNCRKKGSLVTVNEVVAKAFTTYLNLIAEINKADDEKRLPQAWQDRESWSQAVVEDMKKNISIYYKRLDRKFDPAITADYNKLLNQVDQLAERLLAPKEELRAARQRQRNEEQAPIAASKSEPIPSSRKMERDRLFEGRARSASGAPPPPKPKESIDEVKRKDAPIIKRK